MIVAVKIEDMLQRGATPIELSTYLLPSQWNLITEEVNTAFTEANFWSCCCEITICIIFLFPFIFCCHPCTTGIILKSRIDHKLKELNTSMFGGRQVLKELNGNILFNTDVMVIETTVYIDRTNTGEFNSKNSMSNDSGVIVIPPENVQGPAAYSSAEQAGYVSISNPMTTSAKQTMIVTVPPNAGPGSVLTVNAPNGTVLSVVVPQNSGPGREIAVQY